jgi:hypothetical protein
MATKKRKRKSKLNAKLHRTEVMVVNRAAIKAKHLVYLLVADKAEHYLWKSSPILYIGTTEKGVARMAESAAHRAKDILGRYGTRKFLVRAITCQRRAGMQTWKVLEWDLLKRFKLQHGEVPRLNESGKNLNPNQLSRYFSERTLDKILKEF